MEIGRLKGISYGEAADLRSQGIHTVETLEKRVAEHGLAEVVRGRLVSLATLGTALGQHALHDTEGKTGPLSSRALHFARTHWVDGIGLAIVLALILGVERAREFPERSVVAVRELAAFQVIGPGDVKGDSTAADFGTFEATGDVVGRFPLQGVPAGDPLRKDQLSRVRFTRPEELAGRRIVSLPVALHAVPLARPATRVALLLPPPATGAAGTVVEDVMVLGVRAAGDSSSLVVAVQETAIPALQSLGGGRVAVLQQVALPGDVRDATPARAPRPPCIEFMQNADGASLKMCASDLPQRVVDYLNTIKERI